MTVSTNSIRSANADRVETAPPLVDVLMLAYNVGPFIAEAIEGVLQQRAGFPIRLLIAEDHSTDNTKAICQHYAEQHPEVIDLMPGSRNLGIAGRAATGLNYCHATYVAICDGDDVWTDPNKLSEQIAFLEANKDHGLSYSDVDLIAKNGDPLPSRNYDAIRSDYASGAVFPKLFAGNFINNSTAVVRRELLADHVIDTDRNYFLHDYFMWLHVAARTQVHFLPKRTTAYRQGGVTSSQEMALGNRSKFRSASSNLLLRFGNNGFAHTDQDKALIFRKTCGAFLGTGGNWRMKWGLLTLLINYMPRSASQWRRALRRKGSGT